MANLTLGFSIMIIFTLIILGGASLFAGKDSSTPIVAVCFLPIIIAWVSFVIMIVHELQEMAPIIDFNI